MNERRQDARPLAAQEPLSSVDELARALRCLPGVGPKASQRMALHLLQHDRDGALRLARALEQASRTVRHCERCNTFTEDTVCALCRSAKRDAAQLCVVETPADLLMVEQSQAYSGLYFVLMGRLSPLDGIGPKEIGLERLLADQVHLPVITENDANAGAYAEAVCGAAPVEFGAWSAISMSVAAATSANPRW